MQDLHSSREASKYKNPIASREYILDIITKNNSISKDKLSKLLELDSDSEKALSYRLKAMLRDNQLSTNAKGELVLFSEKSKLSGKVIANPRGFGFVNLSSDQKDLRLSKTQMQLVFHNEIISLRRSHDRNNVQIISIDKRIDTIVGQIIIKDNKAFLQADDRRITQTIIIPKLTKNNKNKQIVVAKIINYPTPKKLTEVKVIKILGDYLAEGVEIQSALLRYEIDENFNKKCLKEAQALPDKVLTKDKKNRTDLTKLPLITIDGEDSRDFDDAVYAKKSGKNYKLWVAIADVSHYVATDTELDKDAKNRATSVYFPNKVVPMLPESISNGLCSLNPQVTRLCLTCEITISPHGDVIDYIFYRAYMNSYARMTYNQVNDIITLGDKKLIAKYQAVYDNICTLDALYAILAKSRNIRGAMIFNRSESQILFNKDGKIQDIVEQKSTRAHHIIEECMLLANKSCAEYLAKHKQEFLYRVHPKPKDNKIQNILEFLEALGIKTEQNTDISPKYLADILEKTKNRDDAHLIQTIILRSMQQAIYTNKNAGHFGLAFAQYTHFTSPIRRYPDLLAHRAIKNILDKKTSKVTKNAMAKLGELCSAKERNADEASRDVNKWLKCEFMSHRINTKYNGVISGVAGFGLFVELENIYIDGVVPMAKLGDDYYILDEANYRLVGKRYGKNYSLGDKIKVQVVNVNLSDRQIELKILS